MNNVGVPLQTSRELQQLGLCPLTETVGVLARAAVSVGKLVRPLEPARHILHLGILHEI